MSDFINKIEFTKGEEELFLPFKSGDKIFFGGKTEVENLIKFYLKSKGVENWEENAKRFKINCILGNNGGGKSTLLRLINDKLNSKELNHIIINNENNKYSFYDNISIFDYTKVNINNKTEPSRNKKSKINEEIRSFMEFTKWTQDLGIIGRFLKYICLYTYSLEKYGATKDYLKYFLGFSLKKESFNFEYKNKSYNLYDIIDDYFELNNYQLIFLNFVENLRKKLMKEIKVLEETIKEELLEEKINNILEKFKEELTKEIKEELLEETINNILEKFKEELSKEKINNILEDLKKLKTNKIIDLNNYINYRIGYDKRGEFEFNYTIKKIINLSSGQKIILLRFSFYLTFILFSYEEFKEKLKKEEGKINEEIEKEPFYVVILIDEPDLHLHLDWQKQYIQKLIDVFSTLNTNIKLHFIIATHSPFIISDLPTESIVVLDGKEGITKIKTYNGIDINKLIEKNKSIKNYNDILKYEKDNSSNKKTFGANFVDIIRDGFFFENKVLMGSFAEENIKLFSIAQKFLMVGVDNIKDDNLGEKEKKVLIFLKDNKLKDIKDFEKYINLIGDNFLKENLLYL